MYVFGWGVCVDTYPLTCICMCICVYMCDCRKTQGELSERSLEASELREAMEERQRELEERVATVSRISVVIYTIISLLLLLRSPAISLGFTFFFFCIPQLYLWGSPFWGEIFAYVTVF